MAGFGDFFDRVNFENALGLGEQTVQQREVATGDAEDERVGLSVEWRPRESQEVFPPDSLRRYSAL